MTVRRSAGDVADTTIERTDVTVTAAGDRAVRWGPVVAGLVTAFGTFMLLTLLSLAIGLGGADQSGVGTVATIVGSVIALVSFFVGGFIASWSAGAADARAGALDGFLVWALWLVLLLVAGGLGLGSLFGAAGQLLNDIRAPDLSREEILQALQTGSLGSFIALALAAIAAVLGGVVGTRAEDGARAVRT